MVKPRPRALSGRALRRGRLASCARRAKLRGMQPASGGRFDARLLEHDDREARFQVEVGTPEGRWSARAAVSATDGTVEISQWSGPGNAPEWLVGYLRAALRAAFRGHADTGWPRRITRWREERTARGETSE